MNNQADLLFELGCEELPPTALKKLSQSLFDQVCEALTKAGFNLQSDQSKWFASPRRLAFRIAQLDTQQAEQHQSRKGPAVSAAFAEDGSPTPAALGFAKSCKTTVDQLAQKETPQGKWLFFEQTVPGKTLVDSLPPIILKALDQLPIPKRMRWGDHAYQFVRPVHWALCLLDDQVIPFTVFNVKTDCFSRGHRFHAPQTININHANEYEALLKTAYVEVDYDKRRQLILDQAQTAANSIQGQAIIHDDVLDEVCNLAEWPVAVLGAFDQDFLTVPHECLISSMETHQRFFPIEKNGSLSPYFIGFANIQSQKPEVVRAGYEKVIRPRLADARFFWDEDRKTALSDKTKQLNNMVFQKELGTIFDKTKRLESISMAIAENIALDPKPVQRAAQLCKSDLVTDMVYEFTELQGIMGHHYALYDGEDIAIASAIEAHYLPRFAGDDLPDTAIAQCLAIADRLDSLCGIFAAGLKPTGNKDPFALRRAALGLIRILIEKELDLDTDFLFETAASYLPDNCRLSEESHLDLQQFFQDRVKTYLLDQGFSHGVIDAVGAVKPPSLLDSMHRCKALQKFQSNDQMASLAQSNKRIINILKKQDVSHDSVQSDLFKQDEEKALYKTLTELKPSCSLTLESSQYVETLGLTSTLHSDVNAFFEAVMVNDDNESIRNNRLALLAELKAFLMQVADLSKLVV